MQLDPSDIGCTRFAALLGEQVDGRLGGADRAACERHLLHCPDCRERERRMRLVLLAVAHLRDPAVPARSREALLAAFRRGWTPPGTSNDPGRH